MAGACPRRLLPVAAQALTERFVCKFTFVLLLFNNSNLQLQATEK